MSRAREIADGPRAVVLRQAGAVLVPVAVWVVCALVVVVSLVEGDTPVDQVRTVAAMLTIAFLAWMFLFSPCLVLEPAGLRVVNPLRVHQVPFAALDEVQVRGLVTLVVGTASGGRIRITSWNAPGVPRAYSLAAPPVAVAIDHRRTSWEQSRDRDQAAGLVTAWRLWSLLVLLLVVLVQVTIWWR